MFSVIAAALVPAFFVMGLGYFAGKEKIVDNKHVQSLNALLMTFALPLSLFIAMAETPASRLSSGFSLGLVLTASMLIIFGISIIIRAWINERSGVRPVLFCVLLCIGLFAYDIFVYEGILFITYNAVLFSTCYVLIFFLLGVSLLYHLEIFKGDGSSGTLTFEELYGKTK